MKVHELFETSFIIEPIPNGKPSAMYWASVLASQNENRTGNSNNISEIEAAILDGSNKKFMIREGERIIAAIAFAAHHDSIHIEHLGSIKAGAGTALVKRAEAFASRKKLPLTMVPSTVSKGFYERLGYSQLSQSSDLWGKNINEGWKSNVASLAAIAALGAGGAAGLDYAKDKISDYISQYAQKPPTANQKISSYPKDAEKTIAEFSSLTNKPIEHVLLKSAVQAGLEGDELAQFMAQCAHESGNFSSLVELRKDSSAEKAYRAIKSLGNTNQGDGAKYKGRSFIQITGKFNYGVVGRGIGHPLVDKPELLEDPEIAAKASIWFWKNNVAPKISSFDDTRKVTKIINGGINGLADRIKKFKFYRNE